jgi:hypothetical protein
MGKIQLNYLSVVRHSMTNDKGADKRSIIPMRRQGKKNCSAGAGGRSSTVDGVKLMGLRSRNE